MTLAEMVAQYRAQQTRPQAPPAPAPVAPQPTQPTAPVSPVPQPGTDYRFRPMFSGLSAMIQPGVGFQRNWF